MAALRNEGELSPIFGDGLRNAARYLSQANSFLIMSIGPRCGAVRAILRHLDDKQGKYQLTKSITTGDLSVDQAVPRTMPENGRFPIESAAAYLILLHPGMSQFLGGVADMLAAGLRELSYTAEIANALPTNLDHKIIVLGANLFDKSELSRLPPESIIFNVENSSSSFITPSYIRLLRNFAVWDYDKSNAETMEFIIARPIHYLRMFYAAELARIPDLETEDIDVLFFGSFNARRSAVLDDLRQRGLTVKAVFGVFGAALDELISRSKVVLNIHFYPNGRLEMISISDLLSTRGR